VSALTIAIFALTAGLAAANGSNDVSKGVATLAGTGVTRYRTAIAWGAACTLAGSLASLRLAHAMTRFGWTPCIGPVLGSVLAVAATRGRAVKGRRCWPPTRPGWAYRSWLPGWPSPA
jgi:PiT family inorganic phosphate transporter